ASIISFFFFSSRRRHTRFSRDWSSDVCSSDLKPYRLDIYGLSKFFNERIAWAYQRRYGIETVGLRMATVWLPDHEPTDQLLRDQIGRASCRERVKDDVVAGRGEKRE